MGATPYKNPEDRKMQAELETSSWQGPTPQSGMATNAKDMMGDARYGATMRKRKRSISTSDDEE